MPAVPSGERGVGPAPSPPPNDPRVRHVYLDVRAKLLDCLNDQARPLHDPAGQVWGVLGTVSSLPEGPDWQLMAELAHDLRTPLQSLKLLAAIFEQLPQTDPQVRQAVDTIRSAADRATRIALELLE